MNLIDISSNQESMRLPEMFRQNPSLDGAIVKAGSGTRYVNPCFKGWMDWLADNGKPFGAYHYCREDIGAPGTAEAEAKHFYETVKPYVGKAVFAADFEADHSDALLQGTGWLKTFLDAFYHLSGVKPLVYCSQSITQEYNFREIAAAGYKLWMAQYADMNPVHGFIAKPWHKGSVSPFDGYAIHQYTSMGYLSGYGSNLDFDLFSGTADAWAALAGGSSPQHSPEPEPAPTPTPAGKKSPDETVISAVLHGEYGNGQDRLNRLNAAGYDADAVQRKINELYGIALSWKKKMGDNTQYVNSITYIMRAL